MAESTEDRLPDEAAPDRARADAPPGEAEAAVLACNAAFYAAFNSKDFAAMERVWSSRGDVTCVRPADEIDPEYGKALRRAARAGVEIVAIRAHLGRNGVRMGPLLDVVL